MVFILVALLY